jgi:thioredoxin 1
VPAELRHGAVVIEVRSRWCSSCRALAPVVERVANATDVTLVDVEADADPDLVDALGVRSVPTLVGLHEGAEVGRLVGRQPVEAVEALFASTRTGTATAVSRAPWSLVIARAGAGVALALAGLALGVWALVLVGAALVVWALMGIVPPRGA